MSWRAEQHDDGNASTSPVGGQPHDINSYDCWCKPTFYIACEECTGSVGQSCWKCGPTTLSDGSIVYGIIEIDYETAKLDDVTCIIAHNVSAPA